MFGYSARALVLCNNSGRQLVLSAMLNRLGIFRMALCANVEELQKACAGRPPFDLFLVDDFIPGIDELLHLENMSKAGDFNQLVLVGSQTASERNQLFKWAWKKHVGLLDIIERPVSMARLREALDRLVITVDPCNAEPAAALSYPLFENISPIGQQHW